MQVERSPAPLHSKVWNIGGILRRNVVASLSGLSSLTAEAKGASSLHPQQFHPAPVLSDTNSADPTSTATAAVTACPAPPALLHQFARQAPLREDKSWRCDLHPAWSRDHTFVAINGRPGGAERQVVLLNLGNDLSKYFPAVEP